MSAELAVRPLATWDAFTVRLDRDVLLLFLLRLLRRQAPQVEDLTLDGEGDRLSLTAKVRVAGVVFNFGAEIEEVRVKGGLLGFLLRVVKGPLGVAVPKFLLNALSHRLPFPTEFDRQSGVVVVDLRGRLPLGLEVEVRNLRVHNGAIEIALGPGQLAPPTPPEVGNVEASEETIGV